MRKLIAYAIAGAGVGNMESIINKIPPKQREEMEDLLKTWRGSRSLYAFYTNLLERNGYTCDDVLNS